MTGKECASSSLLSFILTVKGQISKSLPSEEPNIMKDSLRIIILEGNPCLGLRTWGQRSFGRHLFNK